MKNSLRPVFDSINAFHTKKLLFFFGLLYLASVSRSGAQNITIVESQTANIGHVMDDVWLNAATNMGFNAMIVPQSALYDTAFFQNTDVLIVSSGVIILTANQIATLSEFMKSGRNLFLQTEYGCSAYNTNTTFETMVNDNGGAFTWNGTIAGTLIPMVVSGTLSNTPNTVTPLSYFWYGCRGSACSYVDPFLKYNGDDFGFVFCPPDSSYGKIITTSDQDWVNTNTSPALLVNILTALTTGNYQCAGPAQLTAYLGADTAICNDSSLLLSPPASGSNYLWSTGSVNSSIVVDTAGIYWVAVTNGSCTVADTIEVTEVPCYTTAFSSNTTSVCEKFCVDFFDSSAATVTSWLWLFQGATPTSSVLQNPANICYQSPGSYDVTLITNSSTGSDTLTLPGYISVNPTPDIPQITQTGNTLVSTAADNYQWQLNGANITGATDQTFDVQQGGYYTVLVTDSNGCTSSASNVYIVLEGIEDILNEGQVSVFPNPAADAFSILLSAFPSTGDLDIQIFNVLGQQVFSSEEKISGGSLSKIINLNDVSPGLYFLKVTVKDNSRKMMRTEKLVVM